MPWHYWLLWVAVIFLFYLCYVIWRYVFYNVHRNEERISGNEKWLNGHMHKLKKLEGDMEMVIGNIEKLYELLPPKKP